MHLPIIGVRPGRRPPNRVADFAGLVLRDLDADVVEPDCGRDRCSAFPLRQF